MHENFCGYSLGPHDIDEHGHNDKAAADSKKPCQHTGNGAYAAIGDKNSDHYGFLLNFYGVSKKIPDFIPAAKLLKPQHGYYTLSGDSSISWVKEGIKCNDLENGLQPKMNFRIVDPTNRYFFILKSLQQLQLHWGGWAWPNKKI
jgi:hypothetical protein